MEKDYYWEWEQIDGNNVTENWTQKVNNPYTSLHQGLKTTALAGTKGCKAA